ncbi:MAG: deoxyribonuclease IV [Dehalococcoidia bacterium]|nr:deoxyribonuclease IV [Dehalococcoidia bacterium]
MRIGVHVSGAGGLEHIVPKGLELEAEVIQLFISAPQQWRPPAIAEEQAESFREALARAQIPAYFHGVYLVNLAADNDAMLGRSVGSLKQYMRWAGELGVRGTVFHVGSHKGKGFDTYREQILKSMREVLDYADNDAFLIMENNAGQGGGVGTKFSELGEIIRGLDEDPRVRVCLDTCHAFAMGYDIATEDGIAVAMEEFDREIGIDRLELVHANDSKMELGGLRDRHENIGDGKIGYDGFRTIMSHPAFRNVPFVLEVPGIEAGGPDLENVRRLKKLREEAGIPPP